MTAEPVEAAGAGPPAAGGTSRQSAFGPRGLLVGAVLLASLAAFVSPVLDPDFWWHVRVGRWIVERGRLPAHDLFTYTVPDHHWVDHEYLTEVAMWLLHARFGPGGVSMAFGLASWLGLLLLAAACRPARHPYVVVGAGLFLAVLAGGPVWGPRPQMVTFTFACLVLLWLRRFLDASSRAVVLLPPVVGLWANLHGGWPVAFLFLGAAAAAETLHLLAGRAPPGGGRRLGVLAAVGGLSLLAVLANPSGPDLLAYPFRTLASPAQQALIVEWRSPDLATPGLWPFWAMLVLLTLGLAIGRPRPFDLLLVVAGAALALESVRHLPLFVAATTPVLVSCWSDAWRRLDVRLPHLGPPVPQHLVAAATVGALAVVAVATGAGVAGSLGRQEALVRQRFPVGAADWLTAHPEVGTRVFNEYGWGGYLADRFHPEPGRRVYVFGEALLMGDEHLWRYQGVQDLHPGWRRTLDEAGVDYAVLRRDSALAAALAAEPDWRLAYRDGTAAVLVRAGAQ